MTLPLGWLEHCLSISRTIHDLLESNSGPWQATEAAGSGEHLDGNDSCIFP